MTKDEIIKEAASKFCGWKIPKDFYPDCYISIDRDKAFAHPHHGPTGTNLFTFEQAKAMFEYCVGNRIAELEAASDFDHAEYKRLRGELEKSNAQLLEALHDLKRQYSEHPDAFWDWTKARAAIKAAEVKP